MVKVAKGKMKAFIMVDQKQLARVSNTELGFNWVLES